MPPKKGAKKGKKDDDVKWCENRSLATSPHLFMPSYHREKLEKDIPGLDSLKLEDDAQSSSNQPKATSR